jgi:hypothetical protein
MIIQEESEPSKLKPLILVTLTLVLGFAMYNLVKGTDSSKTLSKEQEKEILGPSIEAFWSPTKELINQINLDAETHIAINKLQPGEPVSAEIFYRSSHNLLSKIDGGEEQVIKWKGKTDDELSYDLIGRIYFSGWTPLDGESYAYATLEVFDSKGASTMERIYPIDGSVQIKKERIKKIEAGEPLPPIEF